MCSGGLVVGRFLVSRQTMPGKSIHHLWMEEEILMNAEFLEFCAPVSA